MEMELTRESMPVLVVESCGYEGVRRVAGKVAEDFGKVLGAAPSVVTEGELPSGEEQLPSGKEKLPSGEGSWIILCATLGKSPMLEELARRGLVDTGVLRKEGNHRKREVYQIKLIAPENGNPGILLICGSDKRGTIYGMFSLSEYIGVSPLCYWGDAEPIRRDRLVIREDIETVSGEPSVKYRGFFINDEWPCFGNWVMEHFGGFNAEAYDHVFELLLRLKGNYLWPAMWSASFPLDGPGSRNEELADIYGVVMGYSHHEPCLRASEEWDKVRGEGSRYGNAWNFYTNEQGLLNYWEDALKRSGGYENIITIGMRGERDTSMLGEEADVSENVRLLKDIITKQKALIDRHVKREEGEIPMLLALYKEVEPYFYGDGKTPGLKDWEGLDGVTCMLCEDNFGYVRTLPTEEMRSHKGGFGMYYHLDYHGGPISYEWVDSTPCSRIWEQMSQVYEYGVRDVWIVNVGDLKFHEVPLGYFLALAYDYDKWGYGNPRSYIDYVSQWAGQAFPGASPAVREKIGKVFTNYIGINSLRRPEALHAGIYHPCHYGETDRMLKKAEEVEKLSMEIMEELEDNRGYYSMVHYSAMASMNLLKMHLYAGKNHHYAAQGRPVANVYGSLTRECIAKDREYGEEWAAFRGGKWNGMQLAQHIGFTRWNEDDYRYPVVMEVEPAHCPRLSVSRRDEERTATKVYGAPMVIEIPDFLYAGCEEAVLEVANGGGGCLHYEITREGGFAGAESGQLLPEWLTVSPMQGDVATLQEVTVRCRRDLLPEEAQKVRLIVQGGDARVAVEITGRAVPGADISEEAGSHKLPEMTFLERRGVIAIGAEHYCRKKDTVRGSFHTIEDYGKYGCGVKVFPGTAAFAEEEEKPELVYRFLAESAGEYQVELVTAPVNPLVNGQGLHLMAAAGEGRAVRAEILPADYRAGDSGDGRWSAGALNQEHRTVVTLPFEKGVQELVIGALEAGTVLEKILIYRKGMSVPESYFGPEETIMSKI
ncbi:MAG: glycosyl hydrolase 115 family protein [Butyrivibrio sp.]|nr:glycosyl hydrolase 115 family protein [Acetatifactor muris]MCM1559425.1 glycosyl hydrolase 115 family protein [Butyrivibrio sp.]